MSDRLDTLKTQLGVLPIRERAELARFLIDSLEPPGDDDEAAWEIELARRVADIRSGRVAGKSADQVFAELRERFP